MEQTANSPNRDNSVFNEWINKEIPLIPVTQLEKFKDFDSIDAQTIGEFSPSALESTLKERVGDKILGIDSGGGSIRGGVYIVGQDGNLNLTEDYSRSTQAENGEGFLSQLEEFSQYAKENNLPVGMSYGGPLDGTTPRYHPKIPKLMDELAQKYANDFSNIFTTPFKLNNDGPAGLISSVDMVYRQGIVNPVVFYLINGGGLGLAVYKEGVLYSTESGHVESVPELNQGNADRPCGIYGDYVCLENTISNKQGLERQWEKKTGVFLNGKQIENKYRDRDQFAEQLFEQVAIGQAAMVKGVAKVFDVDIESPNFAIVTHGGMQRTPNLRTRMAQILWQEKHPTRQIYFTEEFDQNACMRGAALSAVKP